MDSDIPELELEAIKVLSSQSLVSRSLNQISNAYQSTKQSNPLLKYSAESVEGLVLAPFRMVSSIIPQESSFSRVVGGVSANLGMLRNESIRSLSALSTGSNAGQDILALLASVKIQIVTSVKSVIDLVGRYAGNFLPQDARKSVRGFILSLPSRLASLTRRQPQAPDPTLEADKVFTLGTESAAMLKGIETVFSEAISGAEGVIGDVKLSPPDHIDQDLKLAPMDMPNKTRRARTSSDSTLGVEGMDLDD